MNDHHTRAKTYIDIKNKKTWLDFHTKYKNITDCKLTDMLSDFNEVAALFQREGRDYITRKFIDKQTNNIILSETESEKFFKEIYNFYIYIEGEMYALMYIIENYLWRFDYHYAFYESYSLKTQQEVTKKVNSHVAFNYYRGFIANEVTIEKNEKLRKLFEYIKNVFLIDENDFDYLINWLADLIQNPDREDVPYIVVYLHGKMIDYNAFTNDFLFKWICDNIVGPVNGLNMFDKNENAEYKGFVMCNHGGYQTNVSAKDMRRNKFIRFVIFSNKRSWHNCKILNMRHVGVGLDNFLTKELADEFYTYLLRKDISQFDIRNVAGKKYDSSVEHFLNVYKWRKFPMLSKELYEEYDEWLQLLQLDEKVKHIKGFTKELNKWSNLISKKNGSKNQILCMPMNTDQLDARCFLNVPHDVSISSIDNNMIEDIIKKINGDKFISLDLKNYHSFCHKNANVEK